MGIHEIRRRRLIELLHAKFGGRQVDLARALGRPANYISRCLSTNAAHRKPIGEKFARHVEATLGLPDYWMDEGTMGAVDKETMDLALRLESLTPAQRSAVEALLQAFGSSDPPPPPASTLHVDNKH